MDCRDDRSATTERGGQNQVHHHPTPAGRSRGCVTGKDGGKVFMFRGIIAHGRVTVPIACLAMTTMLPFSAATVDAVPSSATRKDDVALYQDTTQDTATGEWVEPAPTDPLAADAAATDQTMALAPTEEGVEPAALEPVPETASTDALTDPSGAADPAKGDWTDPAPVDTATEKEVPANCGRCSAGRPRALRGPGAGQYPRRRRNGTVGRADRHGLHRRHRGRWGSLPDGARLGSRDADRAR